MKPGTHDIFDYLMVSADYLVDTAYYWRVNADDWLVSANNKVATADCLLHMKLLITGWL